MLTFFQSVIQMGNINHANNGVDEAGPTPKKNLSSVWAPIAGVSTVMCCLLTIATVVVVSLIAVYLPQRGANWPENTTNGRTIQMALVISLTSNTTPSITNYDSLTTQINQKLNYPSRTIEVQATSLSNSGKRKKRQSNGAPSCAAVFNGSTASAGNNRAMSMGIIVRRCPKSQCATDQCVQNCLQAIKSDITSKLGSNAFSITIQTDDGKTWSTSCQFCMFDQVNAIITSTTATTATTATMGASITTIPTDSLLTQTTTTAPAPAPAQAVTQTVTQTATQTTPPTTTTTTTPTATTEPFVCPSEDIVNTGCNGPKDCLYPDPTTCNGFIQCVVNADGTTGTPYKKLCPSGLEWNDNKKVCDWPTSSTCKS